MDILISDTGTILISIAAMLMSIASCVLTVLACRRYDESLTTIRDRQQIAKRTEQSR